MSQTGSFLTTTLFGEVIFHVQIRIVKHCWCMNSSCGHLVHSISKSHGNSWNISFIICTLLMSWPRPWNPNSFDQGRTGIKWIFLETLIVFVVKYHLSWMFASWIVHFSLMAIIWAPGPFRGFSHPICKTGSHCSGWKTSRERCFLSSLFGS